MARGAGSPGGDSSSSGFSSDEDMAEVSDLPSASAFIPSVAVQVLDEDEGTGQNSKPMSPQAAPEGATASSAVLQCCQDATDLILQSTKPLDVPYEQFTAAIGHVTWHWPSSESAELEKRLQSYHSLRAELYKTFQEAFPLTEAMYEQWIADCGVRGDAAEQLKSLFELSQGDYWSVPLTLQYLRFIKESGDAAELQTAMDKAQKTLGTHFARGHEVWALCRELTTERFDEMEGELELLKERAIRDLFCKQMQLPLDQNDLVMSEFRAWDAYNTLDGDAAGSALEEASKRQSKLFAPLMKKLRGFEARVHAAPGTEDAAAPEQAWQQYLNFVKHRVAPLMSADKAAGGTSEEGRQLVVCLYERAVSVMCLSPVIWSSYLDYLEPDQADAEQTKSGDKLAVARRAVRNVPFDSSAWTELLIEMEWQGKPVEEISLFVRTELLARSSPPMDQFHMLSVLLTWCDSVRRYASTGIDGESLEDTMQQVETLVGGVFSECEQFLSTMFPDFLEGRMRLTEYQAKCYWALMPPQGAPRLALATAMKVSKVNTVWKKMLSTPLGGQAATWISYLEATQHMSAFSVETLRAMVFDEAVQRVTDTPLALAEVWLVFERENGDLPHYLRARQYHAKHRGSVQLALAPQLTTRATSSSNAAGDKKLKKAKKRKSSEGNKQTKEKQPAAKRPKPNTSNHEKDDATKAMEIDEDKTEKRVEKKKVHESLTNEHTLFLCNVSRDASKGDIEAMFRDIPTLKDVRLVVKTRGDRVKPRGMAYVQFMDDAGVEAGLKRDGFLLHGHPLRVERSKPPPSSASTPAGKSAQGGEGFWKTDPLTLYVGALNREGSKEQVTEQQLQESLQQAMHSLGELVVVTRVSILKDRHGTLKNYGLVEVAEPSQAAFCLANVAALQSKLGEQVTTKPSRFSIAHILEQQEKQQKQKQQRKAGTFAPTGRGGAGNKGGANAPHARPSTRLALPSSGSATSLMPRALRRKLAAQDSATKAKTDSATATTVTPKSNEDFRKMLFNK
ncbi:Squamous cell carcinoma antigen recognized by T-cells 3 [Phytophthora ramorum]|uniref:RRM domain-containing protein n=1 Tax=Phytophthora ramorum TaxID=164328 RepID=H3GEY7_PHYRM|nr:Squamous cell carcinoma antigen recognized by T-cells 3 [Phytophthora ramorum]